MDVVTKFRTMSPKPNSNHIASRYEIGVLRIRNDPRRISSIQKTMLAVLLMARSRIFSSEWPFWGCEGVYRDGGFELFEFDGGLLRFVGELLLGVTRVGLRRFCLPS